MIPDHLPSTCGLYLQTLLGCTLNHRTRDQIILRSGLIKMLLHALHCGRVEMEW